MFYLFVKFYLAIEKLTVGHFAQHIAVSDMQLVLLHDYQIAIWNLFQYFPVRQVKVFHERRNLPKQALVAYNFGFAIRLATFLAKPNSPIKFPTETIE